MQFLLLIVNDLALWVSDYPTVSNAIKNMSSMHTKTSCFHLFLLMVYKRCIINVMLNKFIWESQSFSDFLDS